MYTQKTLTLAKHTDEFLQEAGPNAYDQVSPP